MSDLAEFVKEAGIRAYPNEACGLIIRQGKKSVPVECSNSSETPRHNFLIASADFIKAADQGEVIGCWHTHVECPPTPSDADRAGCENTEVAWVIGSIYKRGEAFEFEGLTTIEPNGFELPYEGRPYVFGAIDCYSMARDYYRRELSIALPDFGRVENFWQRGMDLFGDHADAAGMVRLVNEAPQPGDLFLIQTDRSGLANHVAIYVGDDEILHHCHGRLSRRDVYGGGYWQLHTISHWRHRSLCR